MERFSHQQGSSFFAARSGKKKATIGGTSAAALPRRFILRRQFGGGSFALRGSEGLAAEDPDVPPLSIGHPKHLLPLLVPAAGPAHQHSYCSLWRWSTYANGRSSWKLIICQMSDTRSEAFHWLLFPLALVIYAAVTGLLGKNEEMALTIFTMLATAAHVHYGVWVGRQLSKHFNIYIFSLKKHIQA
uniref:Uncharacterized protein n=1 Tax=Chrysemys picta bellii TaxID=8478 RepID=A0A8C3PB85_CHRPI